MHENENVEKQIKHTKKGQASEWKKETDKNLRRKNKTILIYYFMLNAQSTALKAVHGNQKHKK